jgi:hypothetical protein
MSARTNLVAGALLAAVLAMIIADAHVAGVSAWKWIFAGIGLWLWFVAGGKRPSR